MCTYNLLVWKWIDEKFDIKWMYLLCFIFVDSAFLLGGVALFWSSSVSRRLVGDRRWLLYSVHLPMNGCCKMGQHQEIPIGFVQSK